MSFHQKEIGTTVLAGALLASFISFSLGATIHYSAANTLTFPPHQSQQTTGATTSEQTPVTESEIKDRDRRQNGINIAEPKIYDNAMLQQMLQTAEARLAALEVINQASIVTRLGSVTGASQRTSSVGVNIQGPSVPGVQTTTKLPTETVTESSQTTAAGATSTSLQTVSGLAVSDEVTTRPPFSPPPASAPAPSTTLPSAFSVSSSDILNEQMQLTAEINGLRLLLAGSLTDYFIRHRPGHKLDERELPKFKTTLGFHVSLAPDKRHKDAVAIVEVEIGAPQFIENDIRKRLEAIPQLCPGNKETSEACIQRKVQERIKELPAVTALIPREKTYNVAAITDKSTSIGGGVATQIIGFSGSWVRGHKTHYLVQDQDTVAMTYRPTDPQKIGFRWQFRPVLGQHYVKAGLKQTFVQLAFPTLDDAADGEIGTVAVRTYWRKYDRKAAIVKEFIPNSLKEMYRGVEISRFRLPVLPIAFDAAENIEELGGGQMLVKLEGRFLPGTYVRIGATPLTDGPRLKHEHRSIKFTAPIAELATKRVFLVAHDGSEKELTFTIEACNITSPLKIIDPPDVTPVDDATSRLKVRVTPPSLGQHGALPKLFFVIGQRVFGDADSPLKVEEVGTRGKADHKVFLSALVPNAVYAPNSRLVVKPLFAPSGCTSNELALAEHKPAAPAAPNRILPLEFGETEIRFLLTGNNLSDLNIISPGDGKFEELPNAADKMRVLVLKPAHLKTHKQILLQRTGKVPFLMTLPEFEPKKPAAPNALGSIPVKGDEIVIAGEGLTDVESITFREKPVTSFKIVNDQTLRLSGLSAFELTSTAGIKRIFIKFKSGRTSEVDIRVVDNIVDTKP